MLKLKLKKNNVESIHIELTDINEFKLLFVTLFAKLVLWAMSTFIEEDFRTKECYCDLMEITEITIITTLKDVFDEQEIKSAINIDEINLEIVLEDYLNERISGDLDSVYAFEYYISLITKTLLFEAKKKFHYDFKDFEYEFGFIWNKLKQTDNLESIKEYIC